MSKHVIYCWSGTGNSLSDAQGIARRLGEGAEIRPLRGPVPQDAETVGFVFPTYYWTLPDPVARFIRASGLPQGAYYYAVATCAAVAVNALADLDALLREKGLELSYHAKHDHVGNYITAYSPFPDPAKRVPQARRSLEAIAADIAAKRVKSRPRRGAPGWLQRAFRSALDGDRTDYDRDYYASEACVSCGLCARVCPVENVAMEQGKPVFSHRCERCMACIQCCPQKALNYKDKTQNRPRYRHPEISPQALEALIGHVK